MRAAALRRPEAIGSERVKPDLFHMPPDIRNFVNQMDAVSTLVASATGKRASGYGPAVCVVSGKGGVGKPIPRQRYMARAPLPLTREANRLGHLS